MLRVGIPIQGVSGNPLTIARRKSSVEFLIRALQLHLNRSRGDAVLIDAWIILEDHVAHQKFAIEGESFDGEVVLAIFCFFKPDRGGI